MQNQLVALALLAAASTSAAPASRPTFLFIVSEDNGPELSCHGDPNTSTPHLDRLA